MRTLLRMTIAIILIASCESITGPGPAVCTPGEEQIYIEPQSVRLVFGTVGEVAAYWQDRCSQTPVVADSTGRLVRDSTVASLADTLSVFGGGLPDRLAIMLPVAPGRTHLVLDIDGHVDSVPVLVPDTVEIPSFATVESGGSTSCGVSGNGTVMCWGYGGALLGSPHDNEAVGQCWGAPCSPMPVPRMTDAKDVWVGSQHACALDTSGQPWCWGSNESNRAGGDGATGWYEDPVPVSTAFSFTELRPGERHTCGLTTGSEAVCWGRNALGQLGTGALTEWEAIATLVEGNHTWLSLAANGNTTCGVTDQGSFLCWGFVGEEHVTVPLSEACTFTTKTKGGTIERIVRCSATPISLPFALEMADDTLFVQVSGTCALTSRGNVGCYDRDSGEVRPVPSAATFVSLTASTLRACALTASGEAWCWGDGPPGDGREAGSSVPVAVVGGHSFTDISTGDFNSCALTVDAAVWCWGFNDVGQAGASILERPLIPTRVRGQS